MSNIKLKKSLGQNFLQDNNIIDKIINVTDIKDKTVLEIGPGDGALSSKLIKQVNNLICIELDNQLIPLLEDKFKDYDNFNLIHQDFLKVDPLTFKKYNNIKVIANLPYYITSKIINKILIEYPNVDQLVVMVQKEVGLRLTSKPNNKTYGSLSVFVQTLCDVKYEFSVSKNVFKPVPKVDSAIISFKKKEIDIDVKDYTFFLKTCFMQKRKTLLNNLSKGYSVDKDTLLTFLEQYSITNNTRAEQLSVEEFLTLYKNIKEVL